MLSDAEKLAICRQTFGSNWTDGRLKKPHQVRDVPPPPSKLSDVAVVSRRLERVARTKANLHRSLRRIAREAQGRRFAAVLKQVLPRVHQPEPRPQNLTPGVMAAIAQMKAWRNTK